MQELEKKSDKGDDLKGCGKEKDKENLYIETILKPTQ